jgi:hypothetical protein
VGNPEGTPGAVWRASGDHVKDGAACTQQWTCDCSNVKADPGCSLAPTPGSSTTGLCASDSGPVEACTRCMALAPEKPCTCEASCP